MKDRGDLPSGDKGDDLHHDVCPLFEVEVEVLQVNEARPSRGEPGYHRLEHERDGVVQRYEEFLRLDEEVGVLD